MEAKANCASKCSCRILEFLESSIGKKIMVAMAGVLLCGFLVTHLLGNLLMFVGGEAFNHYAEMLESNKLLPAAEIGLVVLFLLHIVLSIRATLANLAARPVGYEVYKGKGARTPGSRTMAWTGTLILAFIIIHVATFKYDVGGLKGTDLFAHVLGWFSNPLYAAFYVLAVAGVGLHLSHGAQSAMQTFGISHPRYTPLLKKAGLAFAFLIFVGFASLPVYFGFFHKPSLACCASAPIEGGSK
ncbi:MAG: succinate dehydrogenase cytochrome b subunit [Elusimicrobia bacterium]|nr:succinate dehydrogenase cytochrome b subunit [Elusimicrobiota bacterium]